MAPASPETLEYMSRYTAGFSGNPPLAQKWSSLGEYLACFDGKCAVNVACLVPNGNVRMEVIGSETRPPTSSELAAMRRIVRQAMEEGAVAFRADSTTSPAATRKPRN